MSRPRIVLVLTASALLLAACVEEPERVPQPGRPVRVETIEALNLGDVVTVAGSIEAEQEVARAFRIGGRLAERPVNVGDQVVAGELIARLDATSEEAAVEGARAGVAAAEGEVATARNAHDRHADLLERGFTTRARYDETQKALTIAEGRLTDAQAQLERVDESLNPAKDQFLDYEMIDVKDGKERKLRLEVSIKEAVFASSLET